MNKAQLIDAIAKDAKLSKVDAGKALGATIAAISITIRAAIAAAVHVSISSAVAA